MSEARLWGKTSSTTNSTSTSDNLQGLSSHLSGELLIFTASRTPLHGWLILIKVCRKEVKTLALVSALLRAFYELASLVVDVGPKLSFGRQFVNPGLRAT